VQLKPKKSIMKKYLLILSIFIAGCTVIPRNIPVKVYNLNSGEILNAVFKWTGRAGTVTATSTNGTLCSGEYLTFSSESFGSNSMWGSIYGYGSSGFTSSNGKFSVSRGSELGESILQCDDKNIIQCEYIVNSNNRGSGFCKDRNKQNYRFNF
jgi:hypothetical protein